MPALPVSRRCAFCREQLAAHHTGETHPACEVPHAAALAAQQYEEAEACAELHAWLDSLWESHELESAHDLNGEWLMGVAS